MVISSKLMGFIKRSLAALSEYRQEKLSWREELELSAGLLKMISDGLYMASQLQADGPTDAFPSLKVLVYGEVYLLADFREDANKLEFRLVGAADEILVSIPVLRDVCPLKSAVLEDVEQFYAQACEEPARQNVGELGE